MTNTINSVVEEIQISGIRRFFQKVQNYPDAVQLTLGQPDFPTPDAAKQAAIQAIEQNYTTYTPNNGILQLREAISHYVKKQYNLHYRAEDEIIVTVGASQALDITIRTLFKKGDSVILPVPIYPGYEPLLKLQGVKIIYINTTETNFKLTCELLEKSWSDSVKGIILPYPSNPTGVTYTADELDELASFLRNRNVWIITDEIYSELVYENEHRSLATLDGMREKTVIINGLSKSHSMTGFRIGYTLAPKEISQQLLKVHQYNVSCATSIAQYAATAALNECQHDVEEMKRTYKKRRDYMCKRLDNMNIRYANPTGAFYIFCDIRSFGLPSEQFCQRLLEEVRLAIVPGNAFGEEGEGWIRISYAYSDEQLATACDRLQQFIENH